MKIFFWRTSTIKKSDIPKRLVCGALISAIILGSMGFAFAGTVSGYFYPGGYYGGHAGYYEWYDYCPMCGHHNCLLINPKGTYEGEITCAICDSDYDGCTGGEKYGRGARAWLTPYVPEPEPVTNTTPPTPKSVTVGGYTLSVEHVNALQEHEFWVLA